MIEIVANPLLQASCFAMLSTTQVVLQVRLKDEQVLGMGLVLLRGLPGKPLSWAKLGLLGSTYPSWEMSL